jgi:hypothetical protein
MMKRYAFSTNTIEWAECPPRKFIHETPRLLKPGRFNRLRKWLFQKLSTPEMTQSYEMKRAHYSGENLGELIAIAMNKQRLRLGDVQYAVVSTETAFHIEELFFERSMTIGVPMAEGRLFIRDFPVVVLPTYTGKEILLIPKDR